MLPIKALRLSQLTLKQPVILQASSAQVAASSSDPVLTQTKSAHEVLPASWVDSASDTLVSGFFKRVTTPADKEDNYPILLAKYDVAISVFMRMWLGETAAEDRLVLDDDGQILGTFSKNLPDYKPMASRENPLSSEEKEPELVCPTKVETLLEQNVARLLTAEWGIGNPDVHPYNISIKGHGCVLDYDECLPRRTLIIKGGDGLVKWLEGFLLNKPQKLVEDDLKTFPILSKGHERKHWPTQWLPGNLNWDKQFQSYETFEKLAAMSHVRIRLLSGEEVSFQGQMFESLLTMLLTYDPEMLRVRLYEYLGNFPLDFMSLPEIKREALRKSDGQLFNERTDQALFVDHMLGEFQQQYDELYRAVVFFKGYKPVDGVGSPVVSFVDFLRNRPSARKKTIAWAEEQNPCFSSEARFNPEKMDDRYAQIWRDAHLMEFWVLWHHLIRLVVDVAKELSIKPSLDLPDPGFKIDDSITATGQVIQSLARLLQQLDLSVNSDPDSKMTRGLKSLIEFLVKLTEASEDYFNSTCKLLNLKANEDYCEILLRLPKMYYRQICEDWSSTEWVGRFVAQVRDLASLHGNLRLDLHKFSDDDELTAPVKLDYNELLNRSHTSKEVFRTFAKVLFEWADSIARDDLIWLISKVKDDYEQPLLILKVPTMFAAASSELKISNPLTCRHRGPEIAAYLKDIETRDDVKGSDILAYVLSTGKCTSTSLNTRIIESILPLVLRWRRGLGGIENVNLMSLDNALSGGTVDYVFYTQTIVDFVRIADQFNHIYSPLSQMKFNKAMYSWVNGLSRAQFESLIRNALDDYEPENRPDASLLRSAYGFFRIAARAFAHATVGATVSRREEVLAYLDNQQLTNAGVLGSIFKDGGIDEPAVISGVPVTNRPLNLCVFDRIFDAMKKAISLGDKMPLDQEFAIIAKVDGANSKRFLHFPSFKFHAKQHSMQTYEQHEQIRTSAHASVTPVAMASSM